MLVTAVRVRQNPAGAETALKPLNNAFTDTVFLSLCFFLVKRLTEQPGPVPNLSQAKAGVPEKAAGSTLKSPTSESGSSDSSDSEEESPVAQPQPPQAGESLVVAGIPHIHLCAFLFCPARGAAQPVSNSSPSGGEQPLLVLMICFSSPAAKTNAVPQPTSVRKAPAPTPAPLPAPAPPPVDSSDDSSEESDSDEEVVPPTQVKSCRPAGWGLSGGSTGGSSRVGDREPPVSWRRVSWQHPRVSVTPSLRARVSKLAAVCESGGGCEYFGRKVTGCASLSLGLLCPLGPT